MKKFVCLLSVASILMFVFMVFIEDVKAGHYVPKVELESMITRLETCRQEYINAQWNSARLSAISLKNEFTENVPKFTFVKDKTHIGNLGVFIFKLMVSIQDKDKGAAERNAKIVEKMLTSLMVSSPAK